MSRFLKKAFLKDKWDWKKLLRDPIGWVWISAFLFHLVALLWIHDFVLFEGRDAHEHGIFLAQTMRFAESQDPLRASTEVTVSLEPPKPREGIEKPSENATKRVEAAPADDTIRWNPLLRMGSESLPTKEKGNSETASVLKSGVRIWSLQSPAKKVVFLIDISGTMWNEIDGKWCFKIAQAEVEKSISVMPTEMEFNVIYYSDSVSVLSPQLLAANAENKERARRFLNSVPSMNGATDFMKGLKAAFEQKPEAIFLFTDGEMDLPKWKLPSQLDRLRESYHTKTVLFGIGFFYQKNQESLDLLQRLCFVSGGDYKTYESSR